MSRKARQRYLALERVLEFRVKGFGDSMGELAKFH